MEELLVFFIAWPRRPNRAAMTEGSKGANHSGSGGRALPAE